VRLPTRLDRYPAKMVSRLADQLIERYAHGARSVLDPFCGSGAILLAAARRGIQLCGIDINPLAELFCRVKLRGFDPHTARSLAQTCIEQAKRTEHVLPVRWEAKHYWFTRGTIQKFERLRFASKALRLSDSDEGMAVLLSYALAVRLCSRADQRSPKPFVSKQAKQSRQGRHFDPYRTLATLIDELCPLYGVPTGNLRCQFLLADIPNASSSVQRLGTHSHVITSPPYLNAQDYFRNFKLELHLLEGVLPFRVDDLRERFIGTERGDLVSAIPRETLAVNLRAVPELKVLQRRNSRLAAVVHRYLHDMGRAFDVLKECLDPNGRFVLVCGDNLVAGLRIRTWCALQVLLQERGFQLFDRFADAIADRLLPPKRLGHKGLIKEELVSAFRLAHPKKAELGHTGRARA